MRGVSEEFFDTYDQGEGRVVQEMRTPLEVNGKHISSGSAR